MALSIVKRPVGKILSTVSFTASASNSGGDVLFTLAAHGMSTGDYVYIYSVRAAYNGYWHVTVISGSTFKIKEESALDFQDFIATGNITFYKSLGNSIEVCVHLPIVYKLKSDLWPINTVDTARTVTSFSNSNGYTRVNLSGDIKSSGSADALEQVKISGTTSLDGIYRILSWSSDINFVIDLSYSASNVFTGGTMQYYYGNYHAIIRVYAGLDVTQYWEPYKPMQLMATFSQQPDANGLITININEFIKNRINILENNLLLDTLPNNVDAFCEFYIDYAESYDDANQYGTNDLNVSQFTSSYASDSANLGVAINSILPFKSRPSGNMTDFVGAPGFTNTPMQRWLTTFEEPVLFVGNYFDVSFIAGTTTRIIERKVYDVNSTLLHTFTDVITNMGLGVYRYPVAQSEYLESYITIQIYRSSIYEFNADSEVLRINVDSTCSAQDHYITWLNPYGGFDYWNFKGEESTQLNVTESRTQVKNIFNNWPKSWGEFADSVRKQTGKRSVKAFTARSQYVDSDQFDGIIGLFSSPLVQEMNSVYDRRTVIVESTTSAPKTDNEKLLMVTFDASYTDEQPSQSL